MGVVVGDDPPNCDTTSVVLKVSVLRTLETQCHGLVVLNTVVLLQRDRNGLLLRSIARVSGESDLAGRDLRVVGTRGRTAFAVVIVVHRDVFALRRVGQRDREIQRAGTFGGARRIDLNGGRRIIIRDSDGGKIFLSAAGQLKRFRLVELQAESLVALVVLVVHQDTLEQPFLGPTLGPIKHHRRGVVCPREDIVAGSRSP